VCVCACVCVCVCVFVGSVYIEIKKNSRPFVGKMLNERVASQEVSLKPPDLSNALPAPNLSPNQTLNTPTKDKEKPNQLFPTSQQLENNQVKPSFTSQLSTTPQIHANNFSLRNSKTLSDPMHRRRSLSPSKLPPIQHLSLNPTIHQSSSSSQHLSLSIPTPPRSSPSTADQSARSQPDSPFNPMDEENSFRLTNLLMDQHDLHSPPTKPPLLSDQDIKMEINPPLLTRTQHATQPQDLASAFTMQQKEKQQQNGNVSPQNKRETRIRKETKNVTSPNPSSPQAARNGLEQKENFTMNENELLNGTASLQNKREAPNRKENKTNTVSHTNSEQEQNNHSQNGPEQEEEKDEQKEHSPYQIAANYHDDTVFAIDFATQSSGAILSSLPTTWFSNPKGTSLPAKFKQINWISILIAKLLKKTTDFLPLPSSQSRIISPCPPYPKGAIAVGYDDLQDTIDIKHMLTTNGHSTSTYRPLMQRVESSGWPVNLRPNEVNRHVQTFNINGLSCYHTLSGSYKGVAQFLIPNYNINKLQNITLPNGKPAFNWRWLKRLFNDTTKTVATKCTNCFQSDHRTTTCKNKKVCSRCGDLWHYDCPLPSQRCQWSECKAKTNRPTNHSTYHCPTFMDERKPITFRSPPLSHPTHSPSTHWPNASLHKPGSSAPLGNWTKRPTISSPTYNTTPPRHVPTSPPSPVPHHLHPSIADLTQRINDQNKTIQDQQHKLHEFHQCIVALTKNLAALKADQARSSDEIKAALAQIQNSMYYQNGTATKHLPTPPPREDLDLTDEAESLFSAIGRPSTYSQKSTTTRPKRKKKSNSPQDSPRSASPLQETKQQNQDSEETQEIIHTQITDLLSELISPNYKQKKLPLDAQTALEVSSRNTIKSLHLRTIEQTNIKNIAENLHRNIQFNLPNVKHLSKSSILSALKKIIPQHEM